MCVTSYWIIFLRILITFEITDSIRNANYISNDRTSNDTAGTIFNSNRPREKNNLSFRQRISNLATNTSILSLEKPSERSGSDNPPLNAKNAVPRPIMKNISSSHATQQRSDKIKRIKLIKKWNNLSDKRQNNTKRITINDDYTYNTDKIEPSKSTDKSVEFVRIVLDSRRRTDKNSTTPIRVDVDDNDKRLKENDKEYLVDIFADDKTNDEFNAKHAINDDSAAEKLITTYEYTRKVPQMVFKSISEMKNYPSYFDDTSPSPQQPRKQNKNILFATPSSSPISFEFSQHVSPYAESNYFFGRQQNTSPNRVIPFLDFGKKISKTPIDKRVNASDSLPRGSKKSRTSSPTRPTSSFSSLTAAAAEANNKTTNIAVCNSTSCAKNYSVKSSNVTNKSQTRDLDPNRNGIAYKYLTLNDFNDKKSENGTRTRSNSGENIDRNRKVKKINETVAASAASSRKITNKAEQPIAKHFQHRNKTNNLARRGDPINKIYRADSTSISNQFESATKIFSTSVTVSSTSGRKTKDELISDDDLFITLKTVETVSSLLPASITNQSLANRQYDNGRPFIRVHIKKPQSNFKQQTDSTALLFPTTTTNFESSLSSSSILYGRDDDSNNFDDGKKTLISTVSSSRYRPKIVANSDSSKTFNESIFRNDYSSSSSSSNRSTAAATSSRKINSKAISSIFDLSNSNGVDYFATPSTTTTTTTRTTILNVTSVTDVSSNRTNDDLPSDTPISTNAIATTSLAKSREEVANNNRTVATTRRNSSIVPEFVTYRYFNSVDAKIAAGERTESRNENEYEDTTVVSKIYTLFEEHSPHNDTPITQIKFETFTKYFYESTSPGKTLIEEFDFSSRNGFQVGPVTYTLTGLILISLLVCFVIIAKITLNRDKKQILGNYEYSPEYHSRNSLEFDEGITSSPVAATLPKIPRRVMSRRNFQNKLSSIANMPDTSKWEFSRDKLRLQTILGQGNFGQVWKAEADDICHHESSTRLVAVKMVKKISSDREKHDLIKEVIIMQYLGSHPNVVTFFGCCTEKEPYMLIMEYVVNGKLLSFLRNHRTIIRHFNFSNTDNTSNIILTSKDLTAFAYCIARGMEYLENKQVIHRDLAARNILVDHNKLCKIADFGMSHYVGMLGEIYEHRRSKEALPIRWMAPESLTLNCYTHKTDVWSFGVLMWEIVTLGTMPYATMSARTVIKQVKQGYRLQKPNHCKLRLFDVIDKCWNSDPNKRPTFTELKQDLSSLLNDPEHLGNYVNLNSLIEEANLTTFENHTKKLIV